MELAQVSFNAGEISPALYARTNLEKYTSAAKLLLNFYVKKEGGLDKRPGSYYVGTVQNNGYPSRLRRFQFSQDQGYALEFGNKILRIISGGGIVAAKDSQTPYELTTPYDIEEVWQMKFEQSADVVFITHPLHVPRMLKRYDHNHWEFEDMVFVPKTSTPANFKATGSGTGHTYKYKVTAIDDKLGEESLPAAVEVENGELSNQNKITLTWDTVAGCTKYNVYRLYSGMYGWISTVVTDEGAGTASMVDENSELDYNTTPPTKRNPFDGENKYPSVCGIQEQRMAMGATLEDFELVEASRSGCYNNFTMSNPIQDNDAISVRATGKQVNTIYHFISLNDLLMTTSNGVWKLMPGETGYLSGKDPKIKQQNTWPCDNIEPLIIGNQALFFSDGHIRTLGYSLASDGYDGEDICIFATHLFEGRNVVDWGYCSSKYQVWIVFDDGQAAILTYIKEHQLVAFTRYVTDGWIESICPVKEASGENLYAVVVREVNGEGKRGIERFILNQDITSKDSDYLFMDCASELISETEVSKVSGIDYLEGRNVAVMVDGGYQGLKTVKNGTINLDIPGKHVKVGLPYAAMLRTLSVDYPTESSSTSIGTKKRVNGVKILVENSGMFKVAAVDENMLNYSETSLNYQKYGEAYDLINGYKHIDLVGGYNNSGEIVVISEDPVPLTINAVIAEVSHGG